MFKLSFILPFVAPCFMPSFLHSSIILYLLFLHFFMNLPFRCYSPYVLVVRFSFYFVGPIRVFRLFPHIYIFAHFSIFPVFPIVPHFSIVSHLFPLFPPFLTFSRFQTHVEVGSFSKEPAFDLFARVGRRGASRSTVFWARKGVPPSMLPKSHDLHKELCWEILRNSEGHSFGVWGRFFEGDFDLK